jgi:hypothetical protein
MYASGGNTSPKLLYKWKNTFLFKFIHTKRRKNKQSMYEIPREESEKRAVYDRMKK